MDIRGCTDNSTRTSVILRMSKRISKWISARTVQPGAAAAVFNRLYTLIGSAYPPPGRIDLG